MLNNLIDSFQAKFPPNRLVALAMAILLPVVITPAAGYVAAWATVNLPGVPGLGTAELIAVGGAAAAGTLLAGVSAGYKWLDGWQKDEEGVRQLERLGVEEAYRNRQQQHEVELALIKGADSSFHAKEALDQFFGTTEDPPEVPPATATAGPPPELPRHPAEVPPQASPPRAT